MPPAVAVEPIVIVAASIAEAVPPLTPNSTLPPLAVNDATLSFAPLLESLRPTLRVPLFKTTLPLSAWNTVLLEE